MEFFKANNVEEAVELAVKFKSEGRYDWFRGQTKDWPPLASMNRLIDKPDNYKDAERRLTTLLHWIKNTPGLQDLGKDNDAVLAIAQHHGIPTTLIDFTTDPGVAGFFAAAKFDQENNSEGCIYCLNTADLKEFWVMMRKCLKSFRSVPDIAFIAKKVPNLWRLEAQHGVFLYAPHNWECHYPLDRITFPHSGYPSYPNKDDIYPRKKSQLELLLDQFFVADSLRNLHKTIGEFFPDAKVLHLKAPPNGVEAKFFIGGRLSVLRSWNLSRLRKWQNVSKEPLRKTALGEIGLRVNLRWDAAVLHQRVAFGVRRALQIDPTLRRKAVRWVALPQKRLQLRLAESLDWLWNGMRTLPYTDDDDIAAAVGLCFALHRLGFADAKNNEEAENIAKKCMGDVVRVGFASWEGSFASGYASVAELRKAVRKDIENRLVVQYRKHASYVQPLMQMCSAPSRLFEFPEFVNVFGRQIISTQVLQSEMGLTIFSPIRLKGFGLP